MNETSLFTIRTARELDLKLIRTLIRNARINILGLDYRRFYVAVDQNDQVVGCGQVKPHKDGSRELASIVVDVRWQRRGVASAIIGELIKIEKGDLWLMCRTELVPFYERYGFAEIYESLEMPFYYRRIKRLWLVVVKVTKGQRRLSVMLRKYDPARTHPKEKDA